MNAIRTKHYLFLFVLLTFFGFTSLAQNAGSGKMTGKTFEVPAFTGIEVGGATKVQYTQADEYKVYVETDENLLDQVKVVVVNNMLSISNPKSGQLKAIITSPVLNQVEVSGAASFSAEHAIRSEQLSFNVSGASRINVVLNVNQLDTKLSGASKATLTGQAQLHQVSLSGASNLNGKDLETETTSISASGASDAWISANQLQQELSGAARVNYAKEPISIDKKIENVIVSTSESSDGDTVNVNVGSVKVQVIDGDSTVVVVGSRRIVVDEKGSVNIRRDDKKHKFNGHWAGVELGINGLLTPDFNMSYDKGLEFLDQRMEKSIHVNINFYEQNIPLNKNGTVGLVSGLGLSFHNYRFANNVMLANENNQFTGYYMEGVSVKKSKLVNSYLTLPLYLEFQTNATRRKEKAHLAIGAVAGWRFSSHTKIYFLESNKEFQLRDPLSGQLLPEIMRTPAASNRNIVKDHNSFQQTPFKLDASVRVGWGIVNLYANYALTPMLIKNRGPELYPFAVGITLTGW